MTSPLPQPGTPEQLPSQSGSSAEPGRPQPPAETGHIPSLVTAQRPRPPISAATAGPQVIRLSSAPSRANEAAQPVVPPPAPPTDEKWIDVDLGDQAVVAAVRLDQPHGRAAIALGEKLCGAAGHSRHRP